ncbi:MAG: hypothetical protein KA035_01045 [Candidatus Levybacteria bacterium]|nr:hypothetical protein [Candidatus Levybacteria bacterium]
MNLFTSDWSACYSNGVVDVNTAPRLSCIFIVIQNIINASLALAAIVAIFLITYSAFQFVTSGGDKAKVDTARKRIVYAIIGLVVILFAYGIIGFISQTTGVELNQLGISD